MAEEQRLVRVAEEKEAAQLAEEQRLQEKAAAEAPRLTEEQAAAAEAPRCEQEAAEQLLKLKDPTDNTNDNDMVAGDDDNEEEAGQHFTEEEEFAADIWENSSEEDSSEEEEGAAEIPSGSPFDEYSIYGKVPKLKDPIADRSILERRSIALKKGLKLLEEEQRNTAKNQDQGMNSWSIHGRSDHILK